MNTFWQKTVAFFKLFLLAVVVIHAILFIILNVSAVVDTRLSLIYKSYDRPNFLLVMLMISVFSIFGWWLFWAVLKTVRQIRSGRQQSRIDRLERESADIRNKAAMLQTRPVATSQTQAGAVAFQVDKLDGSGSETR